VIPSTSGIVDILNKNNSNANFTKGRMQEVQILIKDGNINILHKGKNIKLFDAIWLSSFWDSRDLAYAIQLYLKDLKIYHSKTEKSTSKISDQILFSLNNIPSPNSVFADKDFIINNPKVINEICGYPVIVKDVRGSRGKYSAYAKDETSLVSVLKDLPNHRKYFYQSFIENDYDWGILVANGKIVSAEKSYSEKSEFRNNVCNGAKEVFKDYLKIPKILKDMAIKASNILQLSWSRSDIIIDKYTKEPFLLEVNRCPGITSGSSEESGLKLYVNEFLKTI